MARQGQGEQPAYILGGCRRGGRRGPFQGVVVAAPRPGPLSLSPQRAWLRYLCALWESTREMHGNARQFEYFPMFTRSGVP